MLGLAIFKPPGNVVKEDFIEHEDIQEEPRAVPNL